MKKALSKAEIVRRIERASEAETLFPLALVPDPVHFAAKWGLPLTRGYLKHRRERDAKANGNSVTAPVSRRRKVAA